MISFWIITFLISAQLSMHHCILFMLSRRWFRHKLFAQGSGISCFFNKFGPHIRSPSDYLRFCSLCLHISFVLFCLARVSIFRTDFIAADVPTSTVGLLGLDTASSKSIRCLSRWDSHLGYSNGATRRLVGARTDILNNGFSIVWVGGRMGVVAGGHVLGVGIPRHLVSWNGGPDVAGRWLVLPSFCA